MREVPPAGEFCEKIQFLSRPVEFDAKYKAPPYPGASLPEKVQLDKVIVPSV